VEDRGARSSVPALTPTQLAAGFGIIAALILLVLGRRRGRRG
jgi:predicted outer membrane lipoprotein